MEVPQAAAADINDDEFMHILKRNSTLTARRCQMHSENHNPTCFKYSSQTCRFNFPRTLQDASTAIEAVIHLFQNNVWINAWNPSIASILRSNHDISFIPTTSNALAATYYVTNYINKGDMSTYQMILAVRLLKEQNENSADPTSPPLEKFALKKFNQITSRQETSGLAAGSLIMGYPDYYTKIHKSSLH